MTELKRKLSRVDPGLLVALVICLLAIWPYLSRSALPQQTDAELHVFRLAELSRLVRAGELYPRWAPNFYYGYGYPIFNYYAPLSYYLALGVELMPALGPVDGVKVMFILGLLAAGVGMYGYVRDNWGRLPGLVAAAAYVYAPYILFVDPHARGDLAEAFSFGVFPLALWALDRLRQRPNLVNWLLSVTLVSAIILTHNLMALVFFGLLLAWAIWQSAVKGLNLEHETGLVRFRKWRRFRLFAALLLGAGLAAFFWLPVALEQGDVNLGGLISDGSHFDFRNHFLSWKELLELPELLDWGATEQDPTLRLGIAQWLLGGLGLLAIFTRRASQKAQAIFFAIAFITLLFLMLPLSTFLWEKIPLLPFLQFPWRLLGPVAAMLAILSAIGTRTVLETVSDRAQPWLAAGFVGLVIAQSLPLLQVPPWPDDFGPTDTARVLKEELDGRWLGTTSTADFVPATIDSLPNLEGSMLQDLFGNRSVARVNYASLPMDTRVRFEAVTPLHMRINVSGSNDFLLRLFLFDFPGWEARVNGERVETELGRPEGFLVVPVPAGDHLVEVEFRTTAARQLGWIVSALSLAVALLLAWQFKAQPARDGQEPHPFVTSPADSWARLWPVLLVSVGLTLAYTVLIEPQGWLRHESTGFVAIPAEHETFIDYGEQIALIGYGVQDKSMVPGDDIHIEAYWKAQQLLDINYQVFVHLLDDKGNLVAQSDKLNPGGFPTERWPMDRYVRDEHVVNIPDDVAPGAYRLSIGLWSAEGGWRLPVLDRDGIQVGDSFGLPTMIEIR